jgi:hypothetical protein
MVASYWLIALIAWLDMIGSWLDALLTRLHFIGQFNAWLHL